MTFDWHFHHKNIVKVSRSYVYVKIALLFFLLITHGCGTLASLAARHTTMCLDNGIMKRINHLERAYTFYSKQLLYTLEPYYNNEVVLLMES